MQTCEIANPSTPSTKGKVFLLFHARPTPPLGQACAHPVGRVLYRSVLGNLTALLDSGAAQSCAALERRRRAVPTEPGSPQPKARWKGKESIKNANEIDGASLNYWTFGQPMALAPKLARLRKTRSHESPGPPGSVNLHRNRCAFQVSSAWSHNLRKQLLPKRTSIMCRMSAE